MNVNVNEYFKYLGCGMPENIQKLKDAGYFEEATKLIDEEVNNPVLADEVKFCMLAWKEMMKNLPREYTMTRQDLLDEVRAHIPDFTEEEFDEQERVGLFKWIFINGQKTYFSKGYRTLVKTNLEMAKRAGLSGEDPEAELLDDAMNVSIEKGKIAKKIKFTRILRVKDENFTKGMFVRVHIPVPTNCIQQSKIKIEEVFPKNAMIDREDSRARSVCWEENMEENHEFRVTYSYVFTNEYHNAYELSGGCSVAGVCGAEKEYAPGEEFLMEEAPNIVFSPVVMATAQRICCGCNDPGVKAKRIYDYLTQNLLYTFMPDYFVLDKITDTGLKNLRGDCGVMALMFITLCRAVGVGARWQSGLCIAPDEFGEHDWAEVYLNECGWVPVDVSFGVAANRYGNEERRKFYFGNLDPYRMIANTKHMEPLTPLKEKFRLDPYDNQDGEIETATKGLYWDEFVRTGKIEVLEDF